MEGVCGNSRKPPGNRAAACETELRTLHNKCPLRSGRHPLGTRRPGPRLPGICPFPAEGHACGPSSATSSFMPGWGISKEGKEGRRC